MAGRSHLRRDAVDRVPADPAVYSAPIVSDEEAVALPRLNEMQVDRPVHADEHHVIDFRRSFAARNDGDEVAIDIGVGGAFAVGGDGLSGNCA